MDSEGTVLDVLLQRHRDTKAAHRFFRLLLKKQGFVPRVIVTDKLKSYEAARKQVMKNVEHRYSQGLEQSSGELSSTDSDALGDGCDDSNLQDKRNDFFLHLNRFESTSTRNNINSLHHDIANNSANDFKIGEKSLA